MKRMAAVVLVAALAGCTSPYPNGTPIAGAEVGANPYRRGTPEFCDQYARQTAANDYETARDSEDSIGSNLISAQQARVRGDAAYRRCLAGRTG
ncbi:hypothetical protein [Aureimonas sp. Leaf454]|uniref:hypothetical protein n=1 Tax=Aureimonas sp. Leaf454 TaxID=1736381 RepID=UPI0012E33D5F|nr:hypothetical protein [Aureimonas sp. Leaf454]